jgi:hypothetical protein
VAGPSTWRRSRTARTCAAAEVASLVADPARLFAFLDHPQYVSRGGDAKIYRDAQGDTLFVVDGRPLELVLRTSPGTQLWVRIQPVAR